MNMIMHDTRIAPIRLSMKVCQVSEPPHQAIASEPSTPYAAHSVAVAQPFTSTTTMNTMSSAHGISSREAASFCPSVVGGSGGGVRSGLRTDHHAMYPEKSTIRIRPGMNPARKMRTIDASAATAYTTMVIDG